MGYDLHITRAEEFWESESCPITLEEWITYVEKDPDMRLDNVAVAYKEGKPVLAINSEGLSVWTAYSLHDEKGNMAWFSYHEGRVTVKNPDNEIITKMKKIADYFNAKVMGDEGELY